MGRLIAVTGILGVLLFWGIVFLLGFLDPQYSHVQNAMSVVGAIGAPFSLYGRLTFILLGISIIIFSFGLQRGIAPGKGSFLGPVLLVVHGIGRIGEGVFAFNLIEITNCTSCDLGNQLHSLFGAPGVMVMIPIPFILLFRLKGDEKWHSLWMYTLATGVVFTALGFLAAAGLLVLPLGLGQRIGFAIWYTWIVVLGIRLFRIR